MATKVSTLLSPFFIGELTQHNVIGLYHNLLLLVYQQRNFSALKLDAKIVW